MALKNTKVNWNEFVQFTASGVVIADFPAIRTALTTRFQEIYGEDIDLSSASADGVYVNTLALMINNILQSFKQYYDNLDVRSASGVYLDNLCALTNVRRKSATNSLASVELTLDANETSNYVTKSITLADKNGNFWTANSVEDMIFEPGKPQTIIVESETPGPIVANAGWIDRLVNTDVVMLVRQAENAEIGTYNESDDELKVRRQEVLSGAGQTILESLSGALFDINGIEDVLIYNNDTIAPITSKDNTEIPPHCIYIVLRKNRYIDISDSLLGTTIYERMTPGIPTVESSVEDDNHTFEYTQYILGVPLNDLKQKVSWKLAKAIKPTITITITPNNNFASQGDVTSYKIAKAVIDYMNKIHLGSNVELDELRQVVLYADPLFRNKSTYKILSVDIAGSENTEYGKILKNPDTYFEYYYEENNPGLIEISKSSNNVVIKIVK